MNIHYILIRHLLTTRYGWDPLRFRAVCHARDAWRMFRAQQATAGTTAALGVVKDDAECSAAGNAGPLPFPNGPFVVYSRAVAVHFATLAQEREETRLLAMRHTWSSKDRNPRLHEDVYFGYVLYRLLARFELMLVAAPLVQWGTVARRRPLAAHEGEGVVHGIKNWAERAKMRPALPLPPLPRVSNPPLVCKRAMPHCCERWLACRANVGISGGLPSYTNNAFWPKARQ